MEQLLLEGDFALERRITRTVLLIEVGALSLVFLATLLRAVPLYWLALVATAVGAIGIVGIAAFLYSCYGKNDIVRQKHALLAVHRRLEAGLREAERHVEAAASARASIAREGERALAEREAKHESLLQSLAKRRADLQATQARELAAALELLRREHLIAGLKTSTIRDAKITGIGPKLKERLASAGIAAAGDVHSTRLQGIQGFGEAKVSALIAWRRMLEQRLHDSAPNTLPPVQEQEILLWFSQQMAATIREEEAELQQLPDDLEAIRRRTAQRQVENDQAETKALIDAESRKGEVTASHEKLLPYALVTFPAFLRLVLPMRAAGTAAGMTAAMAGGAAVLGLALNGAAALWASSEIALASIPTMTPTPTSTPTPTRTATVTYTITPTITMTPTRTLTPTKTLTPTMTLTPTLTMTATVTFTPTETTAPTITLPAGAAAQCIPDANERQIGEVVGVTDGDTISVRIAGRVYPLRYIGMDTAELAQEFGYPAAERNSDLVLGRTVTMIRDVSETDQYDRLLRYVLVGSIFVNQQMILDGWARAAEYPPDTACRSAFREAETTARGHRIGIWVPTRTPRPTSPPSVAGGSRNCSASYPDFCIAPPPPDLDCGDIPYGYFTVLSPDPHGFDGDHDGIGCE